MMMSTHEQLQKLRLHGIMESFDSRIQQVRENALSHEEWLTLLLDDELERREGQNLQRRVKTAHFDESQTFEDFDFSRYPDKIGNLIKDLRCGHYITHHQHVIIAGPPGTGKSHLAQALGHQACRQGKKVKYVRCSCLFRTLKASRADDTWEKRLKGYVSPDLLIIDDFGLKPLSQPEAEDLYELIAERHLSKSFIFTSNRKLEHWIDLFPDAAMGNACLDRLVHKSHPVILEGESYRRQEWLKNQSPKEDLKVMKKNVELPSKAEKEIESENSVKQKSATKES